MKPKCYNILASVVALILASLYPVTALAADPVEQTHSASPYFFVKSDDPQLDQLPLKATTVDGRISGVIADITVTQIYQNEGRRPIEAIYVFPASTRAAVYGMRMTIGERVIEARIDRRQTARDTYENAKQAGQSASLLEQQRPNVFQMNVANIFPGDKIEVELKYTELLVPEEHIYEFVFPTVVGPRYVDADHSSTEDRWVSNPYRHAGAPAFNRFSLSMNIDAGLPIQDVGCPSHPVKIEFKTPRMAAIHVDAKQGANANRDFILRYRLAGRQISTGLLLHAGEQENHFLLMLQPPKRVTPDQIPPREYIFIVDVSGSMNGFPLEISKKLLRDLIAQLRPSDRFNVLLFAGATALLSDRSLPASRTNIDRALRLIDRQRGGGGTRLLPALEQALTLPRQEGWARSLVVATDGYVQVEAQAFDLIRKRLGEANLFAFGIGSSVNRHLIEGMAHVGMGEPLVITRPAQAPQSAEKFRQMIASPVLTDIRIDWGAFDVYDVEPPSIADLLGQRPIIVFGKWRGRPRGTIRLQGHTGQGSYQHSLEVDRLAPNAANRALGDLWARYRIKLLGDYNRLMSDPQRIEEITRLGIAYHLLTPYTAFIAVDTQIRGSGEQPVTVRQPLPLPQGVSDLAVAGRAAAPVAAYHRMGKRKRVEQALPTSAAEPESSVETKATDEDSLPAKESITGLHILRIESDGKPASEKIRRVIAKQIKDLYDCLRSQPGQGHAFASPQRVTLSLNRQGHVVKVRVADEHDRTTTAPQCFIDRLKALPLIPQTGAVPRAIVVTMQLQ
jgi:Ca-activated chloride channel family protein